MSDELVEAFKKSQNIARQTGGPFLFGSLIAKPAHQWELQSLIAFFSVGRGLITPRINDSLSFEEREQQFGQWMYRWELAVENGVSDDPYLYTAAHIFNLYDIPPEHGTQALRNVQNHARVSGSYSSSEDFRKVFLGIGEEIAMVLGYWAGISQEEDLQVVRRAGRGIQLSEILTRCAYPERSPFPKQVLEESHVSFDDLYSEQPSLEARDLIAGYAERAFTYLSEARSLFAHVVRGKLPFLLTLHFHEALLIKLQNRSYIIGPKPLTLSFREKLSVLGRVTREYRQL